MIDRLNLKFGSSPGQPNLEVVVSPITVFVGPNNSGKSRILLEIEQSSKQPSRLRTKQNILLQDLDFTPFTRAEIEKEIANIEQQPSIDEAVNERSVIVGKICHKKAFRIHMDRESLISEAINPHYYKITMGYFPQFIDLYMLKLDGTNRLSLLEEVNSGDLQQLPPNQLAQLFSNNSIRAEISRIIYEAFGKYYVIDPTHIGRLRVRLSDRKPNSEIEEKGLLEESVNFHKAALLIDDASDGVKAFTGIITTLLAGDPKITLIDEPEAFLHPALATKLGKAIGVSLINSKKRLFVSTHSSSFLMGCIHSGAPLNIIRLTYKNGVPTARLLPKEKILELMRNPLLRSTGVLNGLFYESVIVTEADSDRAFYQEINERLLAAGDARGINNCLFINAQNKQTVWDIVRPLRELGIPAAGVVDIDVLKEGGKVFAKLLEGISFPPLNHKTSTDQRGHIFKALEGTGKDWKRGGGIDVLSKDNKEAANDYFNQLDEYGAFVIRNGELEFWLKTLGATGHGPVWLIKIFQAMGDNPEDGNYLKPASGDVWDFIGKIKKWIENPVRKGIPE